MSIYDVFSGGNKPYDKEQWAAQKQAERKEAYELIDNTCSEMAVNGDSFRQYLDVQGRFDRYSVANAVLVSAQMPEATQLKDYGKWKQSRVYVNKDAQKITILEPSKEYLRDDGTKAVSYNAKVVYDISETSAKDRQEAAEPKSMRELVSAMIDASPVPFQPVDDLELPAFYDSEQQTIFIRTGLNEEQLFVSMSKEVAAAVYDFKTVQLGGFRTCYCRLCYVVCVGNGFCRYCGVGCLLNFKALFSDVVYGLVYCLSVADYGFNVLPLCAVDGKQILVDFEVVYAVYIERSAKNHINNRADFACAAVFYGEHGKVTFAVFHRGVCRRKVGVGNEVSVGVQLCCGNVRKCAFYAGIGNLNAFLQS